MGHHHFATRLWLHHSQKAHNTYIAADRKTVAKLSVVRGSSILLHVSVAAFLVSVAGMWQDCNKCVSKRLFYLETGFLAPKSLQRENEFQRP
jgi:hypothetical protein